MGLSRAYNMQTNHTWGRSIILSHHNLPSTSIRMISSLSPQH